MSNNGVVVTTKQFNIDNVSYGEPKINKHGGKAVMISYYNDATSRNQPLIVQTPKMKIPFGLQINEDPNNGKISSYQLSLSFGRMGDQYPKHQLFYDVVDSLEKKIISDASRTKSSDWLGKKNASQELVETLFRPKVVYSIDKATHERNDKFPPTFKVKVPWYDFPNQGVNRYSDFVTGWHPGNVPSGNEHTKIIHSAN